MLRGQPARPPPATPPASWPRGRPLAVPGGPEVWAPVALARALLANDLARHRYRAAGGSLSVRDCYGSAATEQLGQRPPAVAAAARVAPVLPRQRAPTAVGSGQTATPRPPVAAGTRPAPRPAEHRRGHRRPSRRRRPGRRQRRQRHGCPVTAGKPHEGNIGGIGGMAPRAMAGPADRTGGHGGDQAAAGRAASVAPAARAATPRGDATGGGGNSAVPWPAAEATTASSG